METENYKTYEAAVKRVRAIKGFYKHVITYVVFNIVILIFKRKAILFVLNNTSNVDKGYEDWIYLNIWSTPVLWGLVLLIHGLYVYRFDFSFFKKWEERKIKEFMDADPTDISKTNQWE